MIGQKKLLTKLDSYTINNFPRTILLTGETGCGKKLIANYISNKLNLDIINISENVSQDELISYNQDVINKIYLIDLDNFTQKQQNQFLKFIEEPSKTNYIILLSSCENQVLETIKNRCLKLNFQEYTKEELMQYKYFDDEEIYSVCTTPGQLNDVSIESFKSLRKLCEVIIEKINFATFANTLTISTKINYKENYDKYDFILFFKVLSFSLKEYYLNSKNNKYLNEFIYLKKFSNDLQIKTLNKENFMLNFLINFKRYADSLN